MKNTLKKVLCTALAAVSLSAMVTVPSSLNKPNSDNSFVNVIEADAAKNPQIVEAPLYYVYVTKGKEYNLRKSPHFGDNIWNPKELKKEERLAPISEGKRYPVYEESKDGKWVRISRQDEAHTRWLYKKRTHRYGSNHNHKKDELTEKITVIESDRNHIVRLVEYICPDCNGVVDSYPRTLYFNHLF